MVAAIAPLVASGLGISLTTATLATNVVLYAGTIAASYYLQQANQTKPESGTKLSAASGGAVPQSLIFGEKETAGSMIYAGFWGRSGKTPNAFYTRVYCLADYPCADMLARCWHSGNKGTIDLGAMAYTASDEATSGTAIGHPITSLDHDGRHWAWVKFLDGSQTTADPFLMDVFGGLASRPWTADMIGRGRALMIVTQRWTKKEANEVAELAAVLQGAKFYDWRKDSTNGGSGTHRWGTPATHEYSANPVVIAYNIMRGIRYDGSVIYGGQNWPARRFDNDSWTAAANVCDENVTLAAGGTEKRYRVGGELSFSETPLDVVDRLLASCAGRMVESGGIYKVTAGGIGASVYSFTDDDVVISEEATGQMFPAREDICNTITGTYVEPDNGGQTTAYKKRTNATYIAEDNGEERSKAMDFDYVRNNRQGQRLALHALNDNRRFMTKVISFPSIARKLEPGDTVNWSTSDRFGFSSKKFITGDVTLNDNGIVTAMLREVDATDADWTTGNENPFTVGIYGDIVPSAQTIAITVSAYGIRNNANANRAPGLKIAWTDDADDVDCRAVRYQVRLLDTSYMVAQGWVDFDETKAIISQGIERNEAYQARAKLVPYSDRDTDWSAWVSVTADKYGYVGSGDCDPAAPADITTAPTLTLRTRVAGDGTVIQLLKIEFDELADARIDYQIRVSDGTDIDWVNARNSPKIIRVQNGLTYSARVRAVSMFGVKGNVFACPAGSITVPRKTTSDSPITAAAGLVVTGGPNRNTLTWTQNDDDDFGGMEVWYSTSALTDFADAILLTRTFARRFIHDGLPNGVTRYYWIRPRDKSGNFGTRYPSGGAPPIDGTTRRLVSDDIADGEIAAVNIGTNAVSRPKIANLAINGDKIDALAVATGHLENEAVRTGKIKPGDCTRYYQRTVKVSKRKYGAVGVVQFGHLVTTALTNVGLVNLSGECELISINGRIIAGFLNGGDSGNSSTVRLRLQIRRGLGSWVDVKAWTFSAKSKSAPTFQKTFAIQEVQMVAKPSKLSTTYRLLTDFAANLSIGGATAYYHGQVVSFGIQVRNNKV